MTGSQGQRKTALVKDFRRSIAHSKGRFASILLLMALGSFALVGLFVTGPDMRATGATYFAAHGLADLTVISDYGLTSDDVAAIDGVTGASAIEYGSFKDVTVDGTTQAVRVMSAPAGVSRLELVGGRMPETDDEIALDSNLAGTFALGDTFGVTEKADAPSGATSLTRNAFTVVGYVDSPEILSFVNMGQSTAGAGSLAGYAMVDQGVFDADVYTLARLRFSDAAGLDPYSDAYRDAVQAHKDELQGLLAARPQERLDEVRASGQQEIDDAQAQLDDAQAQLDDTGAQLSDASAQLDDAAAQIAAAKGELASSASAGRAQLDAAHERLASAAGQLSSARAQLDASKGQIDEGARQLADGQVELASQKAGLDGQQASFDQAAAAYEQGWESVSAGWQASQGAWAQLDAVRDQIPDQVDHWQATVAADPTDAEAATQLAAWTQRQDQLAQLDELKASYDQLAAFAGSRDDLAQQLAQAHAAYDAAAATLSQKSSELADARVAYDAGEETYAQNYADYQDGVTAYQTALAFYRQQLSAASDQILDAQSQLDAGRREYEDNLDAFNEALPDAQSQITDAAAELAAARARLERLTMPSYETDTRREAPGSQAYATYDTISQIVDSLARVFPVLLYLVAALVTLSTMTRMVDEERVNSGTLKALGYSDADIAKKFVLYGALAGGVGAALGIVAGHTLMPWIVYTAYGHAFTLPPIQLGFYPGITAIALALAAVCSVLPAFVAVKRELLARPAELLLPKPPRGGSKIFLERLTPVWRRMSFTHKVTARNLFRYKQRMLMTVLGVAGAVCMLVAGFGVQHSISKMGTRQFDELLNYDMIVARTPTATDSQLADVDDLLESDAVAAHAPVRYESVSREGGANQDRQDVTLLVPQDDAALCDYVLLNDRTSGATLALPDEGAVISERLASLLGLQVGDTLDFTAADGGARSTTVAGISEMYMGHFMFMSREAYEACYGADFSSNADLVRLCDGSTTSVEDESARFMDLAGVRGVVQNTALEDQINTVVTSLDMIMTVLIVVATLLGIVIMYNLTNLNVSERMRELSTIKVLGFHTNEATMYIYRETIALTALGLLAGYALGVALHEYILVVVPPDEVMFNPALSAIEFAVPAAVVAAITVVLYFVVVYRLRHVDMLEALKSVE